MPSRLTHLECARCCASYDPERVHQRCRCGGTLLARYARAPVTLSDLRSRRRGLWRFEELLPPPSPITAGEIETPLLFCPSLSERWGVETYIKDDSLLPSGTFKARGAAIGVSRAVELGVKRIVMPSAGNAGAAWALYAARAGIELTVTMAASAPATQQGEVTAAGARLELVDGTLADAGTRAADIASATGAFLAATFSEPYRLEGKKTCWFEVFDALGDERSMRVPATVVLPVGGGVAAVAALKAAREAHLAGWMEGDVPRLVGVQAAGCSPIARAFDAGATDVTTWTEPCDTVAAGLRVPAPAEGALVLESIRATSGRVMAVDDDSIVAAVRDAAAAEGVLCCPEGAAAVAGAGRLAEAGDLAGPVIIYNTGAGIKYPEILARAAQFAS